MRRLELISKELTKRIMEADILKQKEVLLNSCYYAIKISQMNTPFISNIMKSYSEGNLEASLKEKIEVMRNEYDNKYFDLLEAEEEGTCEKGAHLIFFARARTLSAILYCFDDDIAAASTEAVYEASVTNSDNKELFNIIEKTLGD